MSASRTVYLVDDDVAVREAVSLSLELAGFAVVRFAAASDFLEAAAKLAPGCLLLDVRMPEMDGLELQERLAERRLLFPSVVMTGHGDVAIAVRAMKAGAVDFLEKPFTKDALMACLASAFAKLEKGARESAGAVDAAARVARLSQRERQVLERLVGGLPNKAIALELAVSPRTVEVYRARLMDKMQVHTLADLVRLALAAGVVPP